jgi:hypothetical protein
MCCLKIDGTATRPCRQADHVAASGQRHPELQSGPGQSTDVNRVTVPPGLSPIDRPSPAATDAMRLRMHSGSQAATSIERIWWAESFAISSLFSNPPGLEGAAKQHGVTWGLPDASLVRKEQDRSRAQMKCASVTLMDGL